MATGKNDTVEAPAWHGAVRNRRMSLAAVRHTRSPSCARSIATRFDLDLSNNVGVACAHVPYGAAGRVRQMVLLAVLCAAQEGTHGITVTTS